MASQYEYLPDDLRAALNTLTRTGVLLLQSGATSFRTKETMERLAMALGLKNFDAFVTPTKIIGIVQGKDSSYTRALRVPGLGVNMARISAIHVLSHHPKPGLTPIELAQQIDEVEQMKPNYPPLLVIVAVALACGSFAAILGGGILEMLAAFLGAACAQTMRGRLVKAKVNPYLLTAACSVIASTVSYVIMHILSAPNPRIGLIASVLLLVPGVPLVTALLDLLHLDLLSGVTRGVYAAIILMNIGIGMLIVLALTGFSLI